MASRPRRSRAAGKRAGALDLAAAATALAAALPGQRWFGSKSRRIVGVVAEDHVNVPGTAGALVLCRVDFEAGGPETYLVALLGGVGVGGELTDALDEPAFCAGLVEQMRAGRTLRGSRGRFAFHATTLLPELLPVSPHTAVPLGAEQSNTSRTVDQRAVLKVFRRIEAGPNPELELTRYLTEATDFREAPRLAGFITYERPGEEPTTLATLHELLSAEGDAWALVQARLDEYYAAAGSPHEPAGAADPAFAQTLAAADAKEARELGLLTGRLHRALASAPPGSALAPEPIGPDDLAVWKQETSDRLDRVAGALSVGLETLPGDARSLAQEVLDHIPALRHGVAAFDSLAAETVEKIRVHGDYHLGQLLRTPGGFAIVDFEGEPARPLALRRQKACALRDVAGMLRSFAYAARVALLRAVEAAPSEPRVAERLGPWADLWEAGVREAFLEGYAAETLDHGVRFLPREREVMEATLRVFELDKALYEQLYELDHRPGWVSIPLAGLRRAAVPAPRPAPPRLKPGEGPFHFVACLELREFVGVRAENERHLADLIDQVPLDSIYFHTHGFLLRHKFAAGVYPNDFATWIAVQVRDQVLGERLAMVDPADFPTLEALREELVAVIDEHLRGMTSVPTAPSAQPFDFVRSRMVEIDTGVHVRTLAEFRNALLEIDSSAIYYHLVEARMRLGRQQNDFATWLEHGLDLPDLAARVRSINPYGGSLERTRARLIHLLDEALPQAGR
jgi:trehalose synthase-fused probable maltokinase